MLAMLAGRRAACSRTSFLAAREDGDRRVFVRPSDDRVVDTVIGRRLPAMTPD